MAQNYSPQIVRDGLVMCLDASQNKSYPTTDLPVKNGLLVWFDASDDSTFSYSSGTEVSQWRDKSGNNFHANQSTTANQPTRNTVLNSRKSVNFQSANGDRLRVDSGMVFTNSVTAIAVIKPGTQNYAYANILDQDHGMSGGANGWVIQRNNVSSAWQSWVSNAAGDAWLNPNQVSYTDNTSQIVTVRKGSSTISLYSNGTSSGDNAISDQQIRQANYYGLNIGSWRAGGFSDRHYNGEICEIVVYNRALSITELKQVHTYFGQKWGILNADRSIIDLSGNDDNGLLGNGTTANIPAYDYYNTSLRFDGTNDYIFLNNSQLNISTSITVETWVKYNAQGGYNARTYSVITCKGYPWTWLLEDQNGQFNFRISTSVTADSNVNSSYSHGLNSWNHVVGTYDGVTQKIYVNGVLQSSTSLTGTINISSNDAMVGCYNYGDYCLTGNVGVVRVYGRALNATEIAQNYEAQKSKFANTIVQQGLLLNLDAGNPYSYAGAGSTWIDVSGNSYNGTLIGSPSYTVNNSGGLIFDSAAKYATLPTSGLAFGTGQFTIETWLYSTSAVTNNIIYASQSSNASGFIALYYPNGSGFALTDFNGSVRVTTTHQTAVSQNTWYHVVGIRNASNQYVVYVNGVASTTNNTSTLSLTTAAPQIASNPATNTERFTGTISTLRLYNRALSGAEILQNYNAIKGRFGL